MFLIGLGISGAIAVANWMFPSAGQTTEDMDTPEVQRHLKSL
jgi:hypothetical protein